MAALRSRAECLQGEPPFPEFSPRWRGTWWRRRAGCSIISRGTNATSWSCSRPITRIFQLDLASLYKLPAPSGQFELVTFPRRLPARGPAGQASFLAANAGPDGNLAHARGHLHSRTVAVPARAAAAAGRQYDAAGAHCRDKPLTRRQRMTEHVSQPALRVLPPADGSRSASGSRALTRSAVCGSRRRS